MVNEKRRDPSSRKDRRQERTLHDVAREAFESQVAAGDRASNDRRRGPALASPRSD